MIKITVRMHKKSPGYEVIASAIPSSIGMTEQKMQAKLNMLYQKLDMIIPGSFKPKFLVSKDKLVITVSAKNASDAQRMINKMEEYIKGAVTALNL